MSISNNQPEEQSTPHEFAGHLIDSPENANNLYAATGPGTHEFATQASRAQQYATIEREERPFQSSLASKTWGMSGIVMATLFFIAILAIGASAERSLNRMMPSGNPPTTGMVIDQAAVTPRATPAYPTVYVQQSTDPSQAPSPLPETPVNTK